MWDKNQKTLKNKLSFSGIGLHSGLKTNLVLKPSEANKGIVFKRVDLKSDNEVIANFKNVSSARLCTKIQNKSGASVSTIEHLMAAFYICGVDNLLVEIDSLEVPIMDGSAKDFVEMIRNTGLKTLNKKRKFLKILKREELKETNKSISIEPGDGFDVKFALGYENTVIGNQSNKINFKEKDLENIYSARTFCLFEDIEKIKASGLAKGGSLDNAIVVKGKQILNEGGLRSKKEFVNHKILDLAGDFMLAGMRVIGTVECAHGGHSLTNSFLRKLLSDKNNFTIIEDQISPSNTKKVVSFTRGLVVNA